MKGSWETGLNAKLSTVHGNGATPPCDEASQQAAATLEGGPASTVEHLMIEAERRGIALPGVSQGGGDGAPSAGQQGSDNQALDFTPSGYAEETLKGCQDGATVG